MPWYLWTLIGTFSGSFETIIDKKLVVHKEKELDPLVTAFNRNLAFLATVSVFGLLFFGSAKLFFTIPLAIFALFSVGRSVIYDYFLKNSEVVRYTGIGFLFPIILILTDKFLFHIAYSFQSILGIFILVLGGYVVSRDFKNKKSAFSYKQWGLFLVSFLIGISEYILFKFYNTHNGVNAVSFYISAWIMVVAFFLLFTVLQGKLLLFFAIARRNNFLPKTLVSKSFDALAGLFIFKAIAVSAVAKVYALESVAPLSVFLVVFVLVKVFGVDLKEALDKRNMLTKLAGVIILSVGSYLIL